jgi:hypothetical protein
MPESKPYLAFDFDAESGLAVLAHLQSGILTTEEVHRFRMNRSNTADLSTALVGVHGHI